VGNHKKITGTSFNNIQQKLLNYKHGGMIAMSFEGIDIQIELYTKKINEKNELLKDPNLTAEAKKRLESEIKSATAERHKWKIRKNNLFTTRHKK
jgi:hypothetical protein